MYLASERSLCVPGTTSWYYFGRHGLLFLTPPYFKLSTSADCFLNYWKPGTFLKFSNSHNLKTARLVLQFLGGTSPLTPPLLLGNEKSVDTSVFFWIPIVYLRYMPNNTLYFHWPHWNRFRMFRIMIPWYHVRCWAETISCDTSTHWNMFIGTPNNTLYFNGYVLEYGFTGSYMI